MQDDATFAHLQQNTALKKSFRFGKQVAGGSVSIDDLSGSQPQLRIPLSSAAGYWSGGPNDLKEAGTASLDMAI